MKPFTVTSPDNALAVSIYALFAFLFLLATMGITNSPIVSQQFGELGSDVWSTLAFIGSSVAVYATLSASRRRDPDISLLIEFISSVALCLLLGVFGYCLFHYDTSTGVFPVTSFGFALIFFFGFAARAWQIRRERRKLREAKVNPHRSKRMLGDPEDISG